MAQRTDLTLPNTNRTCTVYRWPFEHARSEKKDAVWGDHQQHRASPMDTKTTSTSATPIPVEQRAKMITCLCFVNSLAMRCGTIAQQRCTGSSAIIRRPIVISKSQIFPSESESANKICKSSQYKFLLVIWQFSLTKLTIYSHAMNWMLPHQWYNSSLLCYFLEHFE